MSDKSKIKVTGSRRLTDVDCDVFKSAGSATVDGYLKANRVGASGSLNVNGDVECERFESSGSANISGRFEADEVESSGSLNVGKPAKIGALESSGSSDFDDIDGESVSSSGSLSANRVNVKNFESKGTVKAKSVDCDEFKMVLKSKSEIDEVNADYVRVEKSSGLLGLDILKRGEDRLTVGEITGDTVEIENVTADRVKGKIVKIGEDCEIGEVDAENLEVDESSKVERRV